MEGRQDHADDGAAHWAACEADVMTTVADVMAALEAGVAVSVGDMTAATADYHECHAAALMWQLAILLRGRDHTAQDVRLIIIAEQLESLT